MTDDTFRQAPPVWWSPTHGLVEVADKRSPDDEQRLIRITDRRVIELPDDAIELRVVRAPARPTLAETRTGHDWCPTCEEEVGTDRATLDGVERCALCGTALVSLPDAATDTLTKASQVLHNSMCSGPACEDHCWDEAQSLADAGLLAVPAPAVDREGLIETLFEAIDDTDGVIDMCRRQADALISAGLIRESSLARGMADAAAGRVRRRDDFLDDEDGDSGEHRG